jgi:hypothetical protein
MPAWSGAIILNPMVRDQRAPSRADRIPRDVSDLTCVAAKIRDSELLPHLNVAPRWIKLSDCLPQSLLRQSEWYNDFVLACGVRDILGTRLIETPSHLVYVGVHQQIGRSLGADVEPVMKELTSPLRSAMLRQMERLFGSTQSKPNPKVSARRIRYYFRVSNGGQFLDETGEEFSTREEAIARASVLAAELTKEGTGAVMP